MPAEKLDDRFDPADVECAAVAVLGIEGFLVLIELAN